jgi:uronate dehydrogenase
VSKIFGESLGRYYADKYGLSVACIRIGSFEKKPVEKRHLRTWVSENDLVELIKRCIEAPKYHFLIVYGVSDNKQKLWHDNATTILGYHVKDNAELYAEHISLIDSTDIISNEFHGGAFCSEDFSNDPSKIE